MTTTSNINSYQANQAETTGNADANIKGQVDALGDTLLAQQFQTNDRGKKEIANRGKSESELRAAARRQGLTLKELAALMGASYSHLCSVANGHRPWTPDLREKAMAVLGEVPGQGVVYRQGGLVKGNSESSQSAPRNAA